MKKNFVYPDLQMVSFSEENVVTTSALADRAKDMVEAGTLNVGGNNSGTSAGILTFTF